MRADVTANMESMQTSLRTELQSALSIIAHWADGVDASEEGEEGDTSSMAASSRRLSEGLLSEERPRASSLDELFAALPDTALPNSATPAAKPSSSSRTPASLPPLEQADDVRSSASSLSADLSTSLGLADLQSLVEQQVALQVAVQLRRRTSSGAALQVAQFEAQVAPGASEEDLRTEIAELRAVGAELRAAHRQMSVELEAERSSRAELLQQLAAQRAAAAPAGLAEGAAAEVAAGVVAAAAAAAAVEEISESAKIDVPVQPSSTADMHQVEKAKLEADVRARAAASEPPSPERVSDRLRNSMQRCIEPVVESGCAGPRKKSL